MWTEQVMAPLRLRFGGYQTEASVHTRALRLLGADLRERVVGSDIDIIANVADPGHKATDLFSLVATGEIDLCYFASSYMNAKRVPSLAALDLPFIITDRQKLYSRLDGAYGERVAREIAAGTPYRLLGFWDNGFRHISNARHSIRKPADCRGLRIRTTNSPLHQEIFAAFGFVPIAIDPAQLAQAIATGVIDAQENPLANLIQFGVHKHHPYVSLTTHFAGVAVVLVNRARFDALSAEQQKMLRQAALKATRAQRGYAREEDARCLELLRQEGTAIVPPEEIDHAAFKAAAAPIVARETARIGADVLAELE